MEEAAPLENIASLSAEELFALLESPNSEVSKEVHAIIKDELAAVKERWLISGLLDYFHATCSKRLLDILIGVSEPHDKYFLDKLNEGLKGQDSFTRFRCAGVLLHIITRNPPPIWIYKIPSHSLHKEILNILSRPREMDTSLVVCCCFILYFLFPNMPAIMIKEIDKILASFFCLLHWTPNKETDAVFKPYLHVAMYSLFHRIYSLYPVSLTSYIRNHMDPSHLSWFRNTLMPMLEQVRLHPHLFLDAKDFELNKKRWAGLNLDDVRLECAKLCLDPLEEICEASIKLKDVSVENAPHAQGILFNEGESSFWSPSVAPSPSTASIPVTPIYLSPGHAATFSDSPPEAAIEATPETTPFKSPLKLDSRMLNSRKNIQTNMSSTLCSSQPLKESQSLSSTKEKPNILGSKLQEIQMDRGIHKEAKENLAPVVSQPVNEKTQKDTQTHVHWKAESSAENADKIPDTEPPVNKFEAQRKRKASIYEQRPLKIVENEISIEVEDDGHGSQSEHVNQFPQRKSSEDSDNFDLNLRRNSSSSQLASDKDEDSGLRFSSHKSMVDFVKSAKTGRLKFLSQCGPPPDISLLTAACGHPLTTPKSEPISILHKSRSFPNLLNDNGVNLVSVTPKRDHMFPSVSLSPARQTIEMRENSTQTVEPQFFDPYEKILEALLTEKNEIANLHSKKVDEKENPSPHQMLELLLKRECESNIPLNSALGWNKLGTDENCIQSYLGIMYSFMTLEREKRDSHTDRNRRLYAKIKGMSTLKVKENGTRKENQYFQKEFRNLKHNIEKLQAKEFAQTIALNDTVPLSDLEELKSKEEQANKHREKLKETCVSLQQENISLNVQLKECQKQLKDKDRQLKLHVRHVDENKQLQKEVEILQKQLLLAREFNAEMKQQLDCMRLRKSNTQSFKEAQEKEIMQSKMEKLEEIAYEANLRQGVIEQYNAQLKKELSDKEEALKLETKRVQATEESWSERCEALAKRNKSLCNINLTQMLELQGRTPTQERPIIDSSRTLSSGTEASEQKIAGDSSVTAPRVSHSPIEIPTLSANSYLARNFSDMIRHSPPN